MVLWCSRRSHLALPAGYRSDSGLSARNVSRWSWVARQHFPHKNTDDCPDLAVFSGLLGGHPIEHGDDGLGEVLRVLLAHRMRGANARRHDPPGARQV